MRSWAAAAGISMAGAGTLLPWGRVSAAATVPGAAAAIYVSDAWVPQTAFDLTLGRSRVGWFILAGAITYGIAALAEPHREAPEPRLLKHLCAAMILVLAFLHLGPYPGVMMALGGGLLMLWAAPNNFSSKETVE